MQHLPSFSIIASLLADHARAAMLTALFDGRALPAGELAFAAGITAQTASSHLAKLLNGGLVVVETEGRHRYYRLAGPDVAQALEQLGSIQRAVPVRRKALSPQGRELRFCRSCYDHLAGQLGVAVAHSLQERDYIRPAPNKRFNLTALGAEWFSSLGVDVAALKPTRRGIARQCLDWTERKHHLAGPLGVQLMRVLRDAGWLREAGTPRALQVTEHGWNELESQLGIRRSAIIDEQHSA